MFRSTFAPALYAPHRNRAEIEFEGFVPVLLFSCAENKCVTALYALSCFIDVEVLRRMVRTTIDLLANITSDRVAGHWRLIIRVVLPPFIYLSIAAVALVMDQGNASEQRVTNVTLL